MRWARFLRILVVMVLFCFGCIEIGAAQEPYNPPRTPDGQPDLQGIWRVWNLAMYDIEPHSASPGVPGGPGVVIDPPDGLIPYKPEALKIRNENFAASRIVYPYDPLKSADPVARCYIPGVPRITYLGFPFQIVQAPDLIGFYYEWNHMERQITLTGRPRLEGTWEFWNGVPRARFEGNTLVVEIENFNDHTWLDMAGNFFSKTARVVERYTPTGPDMMNYEVTIEDPRVFTRPWKMRMAIHRQRDLPRLLDYECARFLEEAGVPITFPRDWQEKALALPDN